MFHTSPVASSSSLHPDVFPSAVLAIAHRGNQHALWPDNGDLQQVMISGTIAADAPVAASVTMDAITPHRLIATLRVWHRLQGNPATKPVLPLTQQQRRRLILMLRALDGWQEHATYRELAEVLLDPGVRHQSRRDWLTSSTRAQIIRIVRDAIGRMQGGYLDLLLGY
ncbi:MULTISPECIES: DUF2285 domain-containing protein [unclassified Afipia]|uniref:T6SS Transcription factor RovC-like DNA binding domain-containing protein n=1 Tax=Afipia massiliensis TaxID=211460 RepID=A0A840MYP6_9BRAD|nr:MULTISPECIES: DUF2285 domain-containing protein [unclassified Afipia]MBB5051870.1 hypothetical protein [Afipia massiliensis]MCR6736067.1 DUF2285 domain-containing protein [Afipia sp.]